jgi:hypothetical protein
MVYFRFDKEESYFIYDFFLLGNKSPAGTENPGVNRDLFA